MATNFNHVQVGVVDNNGDVNVLYPQNTASDVLINKDRNPIIPETVNKLQDLVDNIGEMFFEDKDNVVFLGESEEYDGDLINTEINDNIISSSYTWSSEKINNSSYEYLNDQPTVGENITVAHFSPKSYIVNTLQGFLPDVIVPPYSTRVWLVEYFPVDISGPENKKSVSYAYQRWSGMYSPHQRFFRFYNGTSWKNFTEY